MLLLFTAIMMMVGRFQDKNKIRNDEFEAQLTEQPPIIKNILISESTREITGEYNSDGAGKTGHKTFRLNYLPEQLDKLTEKIQNSGIEWEVTKAPFWMPLFWMPLLSWIFPIVLMIGFFYFFFVRNLKNGPGGMLSNFGRSKHRMQSKEQMKVTFEDVAGIDEAKEEVSEIIEFLKTPKKFQKLGGRIPRGILLVGPPGCGKTLLAKAIAGQANVPFFSISGSDFVEMFVGVGASRVRDLFRQAKENSPCIIFLDEIDAIGRKRGPGFVSGGHDEREQTLNAILVEMDGFDTNDQVIVMAATNRGDILDHALTRPGRFDRQVFVSLPDIKGRAEILKIHARKIKLGADVDLERLARGTPMFSGADLEAIINEGAIAATMNNKDSVEMEDLEEARDKVRWGRSKRSRSVDKVDKNIVAFHEAGHTLARSLLKDTDPLHKVSIIPRGPMGGATFALPEKDRTLFTKRYCMAQLQVCFGGRIAEELFCDDISSGAQSDIKMATSLAREMVQIWGMSSVLGPVDYGSDSQDAYFAPARPEYSEKTSELIDTEIRKILDEAYSGCKELIENNRTRLEAIAGALLKYETLDASEVELILDGKVLDRPTVSDLLEAEQKRDVGSTDKNADKDNSEPDKP
ncbi:MAG: ATP-dependent zinc metalloprotease FtsH [Planctomycetes bacterium]|nr:ATP-dependent zinc metalloprotease FtsH [Planctomycetota bacterium]